MFGLVFLALFSYDAVGISANPVSADAIERDSGWGQDELEYIGDDDWSVAGFDIVVSKVSPSARSENNETAQGGNAEPLPNPLEKLQKINLQKFVLSESASAFWRETIQNDEALSPLRTYPLIKDRFKFIHGPEPTPQTLALTVVPAGERPPRPRPPDQQPIPKWFFITLLGVIILLGLFLWGIPFFRW